MEKGKRSTGLVLLLALAIAGAAGAPAARGGVMFTSQNRYVQNGQHWAENAGIGPITEYPNPPVAAPDMNPWTVGTLLNGGTGQATYYQNSSINPTSIVAQGRASEGPGDGGNVLQSGWAKSICDVTFTVDSPTPYMMTVWCNGIAGPSDICSAGTVKLIDSSNNVINFPMISGGGGGPWVYTGTLTPGLWTFDGEAIADHHAGPLSSYPPVAFLATFQVPEPSGALVALAPTASLLIRRMRTSRELRG